MNENLKSMVTELKDALRVINEFERENEKLAPKITAFKNALQTVSDFENKMERLVEDLRSYRCSHDMQKAENRDLKSDLMRVIEALCRH
jgi:chromosome segregation ATPase